MARRQQNRAAQDWAVGRKILDRASKSVTSCNVDSPETKWCDSFSQSKGGKLYLAHMCSFLSGTRRLELECGTLLLFIHLNLAPAVKVNENLMHCINLGSINVRF